MAERRRLEHLVEDGLDEEARAALQGLLVREDTLSELAALKQDAKHFGYRMMAMERQKRATLAPLHRSRRHCCPSSTSRSRTSPITPASPITTRSTICAG